MIYVEAPNKILDDKTGIFLAGGITGCPDWQADLLKMLDGIDAVIYNPRRKNFPINDPNAAYDQIKWEYDMLRKADIISFWFCKETMCPIVLFELGAWSMTGKPIIVGVDPKYQRKQDVEIQLSLARPDVNIRKSLEEICSDLFESLNQIKMFGQKY